MTLRVLTESTEEILGTAANERAAAEALVSARASDYALLLKPRVMSLVVFTGVVGLFLAPGEIAPWTAAMSVFCIALGAGAAGAINMWYDRDIDQQMTRTMNRPIPAGRMKPARALLLGIILSMISVFAMALAVNTFAAFLLSLTIAYYVFVYTIWLKRRTPLNIVVGGASGAFPPMIGWAAVTGGLGLESLALFAIIFTWTPPHFWSLALFRCGDYANAGVPMLPVVAGLRETKKQILAYSLALVPLTFAPVALGMSGLVYAAALVLGVWLLRLAVAVWRDDTVKAAKPMFFFSIFYLFLIFVFLLVDRVIFLPL